MIAIAEVLEDNSFPMSLAELFRMGGPLALIARAEKQAGDQEAALAGVLEACEFGANDAHAWIGRSSLPGSRDSAGASVSRFRQPKLGCTRASGRGNFAQARPRLENSGEHISEGGWRVRRGRARNDPIIRQEIIEPIA